MQTFRFERHPELASRTTSDRPSAVPLITPPGITRVMPVWSVSRPTWPRRPPSGHRIGLRQVSLEVCCERLLPEACQELLVAEHVSAVPGQERP